MKKEAKSLLESLKKEKLVLDWRKRQQARFKDRPKITCNARMGSR